MNAHEIIVEASNAETTELEGLIGVNPNKPEFGSITMRNQSYANNNGFVSKTNNVYFLSGRIEDLKGMAEATGLKVGSDYSKAIAPSRLIVQESHTPFYEGQDPKINPETQEVIEVNGKEVFRQTKLVAAQSDEQNTPISSQTTKVAEAEELAV